MAGRPVNILAAYLSPSRPLIGADITACFGGGLTLLLAGDLNAKHVDWNSRLNKETGKILREYADENSCLIFGPDAPTTNPYRSNATPDVLDIAMVHFPFPVYLTSCSALSSDHLPVPIDTTCRSSISTYLIALISGATNWATSKSTWKIKFRSIRNCTMGWQSTRALRNSPAQF
jgi:hypothetical protein